MSTLCMETIGVCNCFDMEILEGASIHSLAEAVKKKNKTSKWWERKQTAASGGRNVSVLNFTAGIMQKQQQQISVL